MPTATPFSPGAHRSTVDVASRAQRQDALRLADAALATGDTTFAEQVCRRVLAVDAENPEALSLLVCALTRAGRGGEALATTTAVLAHFRSLQQVNSQAHALLQLQARGFAPRGLLDVGAYHGEFAMVARQVFPDASVLMVEPQPGKLEQLGEVARLLGGDCHVRNCLLGDGTRTHSDFHLLDTPFGSTGSSVYPEVSDFPRTVLSLPVRTVDDLLEGLPGRHFDLVKLDVQGAELDVLRGARRTLPQIEVLLAELSLHVVNRGSPLLAEVVAALDGLGFAMFDLLQLPRSHGLLQQVDAVFVRRDSPRWARA
jgi:FkbM family methyltransferase